MRRAVGVMLQSRRRGRPPGPWSRACRTPCPGSDSTRNWPRQASGLKHIKPPTGVEFVFSVLFDPKIDKEAQKDPLLTGQFDKAGYGTGGRFVQSVGLRMRAAHQTIHKAIEADRPADLQAAQSKMNSHIEQMRISAQQCGARQVQRVWDDLARGTKEYTRYQIKIVTTISSAAPPARRPASRWRPPRRGPAARARR
jgi:hypothetical protein